LNKTFLLNIPPEQLTSHTAFEIYLAGSKIQVEFSEDKLKFFEKCGKLVFKFVSSSY
jgi:hypothetical protein